MVPTAIYLFWVALVFACMFMIQSIRSYRRLQKVRQLNADLTKTLQQKTIVKEVPVVQWKQKLVEVPMPAKPPDHACPHCKVGSGFNWCRVCGHRILLENKVITRSVSWKTVNEYLHRHAHWNFPLPYADDDQFVLPWIKTDGDTFIANDSEVHYASETPKDHWKPCGSWCTSLRCRYPVFGRVKLINLNHNNDHYLEFIDHKQDNLRIAGGKVGAVSLDIRQVIQQMLSVLYWCMNNEPSGGRLNPEQIQQFKEMSHAAKPQLDPAPTKDGSKEDRPAANNTPASTPTAAASTAPTTQYDVTLTN
jgi:hypothetical protein